VLGETLCPVTLDYLGVRHTEPGEVLSRGFGYVREALHRPHEAAQAGEQRRLPPVARADLQHPLRAL
jgi:hypothetical protein